MLLSSPTLGMTSVSSNPSALLGISIVECANPAALLFHCHKRSLLHQGIYYLKITEFYVVIFLCQFECSQESVSLFLGRNGRVGKLNGSASKFEGEYVSL